MVDISIVNETSPEANWNRRTEEQDYILSQADALNKNCLSWQFNFAYKVSNFSAHNLGQGGSQTMKRGKKLHKFAQYLKFGLKNTNLRKNLM